MALLIRNLYQFVFFTFTLILSQRVNIFYIGGNIMKRFLLFMTIAILFTVWGCSKKVVTSETAVGQIPKEEAAQTEAVEEKETAAVAAPVEAPSITPEAVKPEEAAAEEKETAAVAAPVEVLKLQDIFFDFDRFLIREEARPV